MKLIHVLILAAIVGVGIIFAVSVSDWSPDNLGGFQSGVDPKKRVYHEPQKLGTYADGTAPVAVEPAPIEKTAPKVELVVPPKPEDPKLAWQYETLVGDYLRIGKRNPNWDQAAVDALYGLAKHFSNQDVMPNELLIQFRTAIGQGCDDPLVEYGMLMMDVSLNGISTKEKILQIYQCGMALHKTKYHPVRRCAGIVRGLAWLNQTEPTMSQGLVLKYTVAADLALKALDELLKDKSAPINQVYDTCLDIINLYHFMDKDRAKSFTRLVPLLERNRAGTSLIPAVAGRFYIDYARDARGNEASSKVTPQGFKQMTDRLGLAKKHLDQALAMDGNAPGVIPNMIRLSINQSGGHKEVNLWFERGLQTIPNDYDLYSAKVFYLQPRWHGSADEIIAFGRECVERARSTQQKNKEIALILLEAHEMLAEDFKRSGKPVEDYWKQPVVFKDLSQMYETLLGFHPRHALWRAKYAYFACLAEQWKVANAQFKVLGVDCPPGPFGGETKLNILRTSAAQKDR